MSNETVDAYVDDSPVIGGKQAVPESLPPGISALKIGKSIRYGTGNLSVNLMAQTFAALAVFYYVDTLGASPALIALAMTIHGIFNAILNPVFGHISDRTKSRWGRRIPYIMFGSLPLAAVFTMIWIPLATTPTGLFWYFLTAVAIYDILFVLVVLNYGAIFPEMFITESERTIGASWRQIFAVLGMILGVVLGPVLYGAIGWAGMGITLGILTAIGFYISLTGTVERRPVTVEKLNFVKAVGYTFKNKAFVAYVIGSLLMQIVVALLPASVPFFTKYVLGDPAPWLQSVMLGTIFVVAIPAVYGWSKVIGRVGPRISILATTVVFAAGLTPLLFVTTLFGAVIAAIIIGIAVAGMLVLLDMLLAEVIDIDARKTGVRREGMYLGINGFIVRWAVSVQAIIFGLVLPWSGYREDSLVQPDSVSGGIRLMIAGIPLVVLLLAFIAFWLYPHRSAVTKILNTEESRKQ